MMRETRRARHESETRRPAGQDPDRSRRGAGLGRRIATYAALSGAAGLGGAEAHATVLYTDLPDVTLDTDGATFDLDFNGDALTEVRFGIYKLNTQNTSTYDSYFLVSNFAVAGPAAGVAFVGFRYGSRLLPGDLRAGDEISLSGTFTRNGLLASDYTFYGPSPHGGIGGWFASAGTKFLGVRFDLGDGTHLGWVQLTAAPRVTSLRIESYAWETVPGRAIEAGQTVPEPSTLSLMALGTVAGMGVGWRRARQKGR